MTSSYSNLDATITEAKTNSDGILIGEYYIIGGAVECIVVEMLNDNECLIVDLFEQRKRRAIRNRLKPIENTSQLESAKSSYRQYLNANFTDDFAGDESKNVTEFTLTTNLDKYPDDNKSEHFTCTCNFIPCEYCLVLAFAAVLMIGIGMIVNGIYLIGSLITVFCLIALGVGFCLFGGVRKHRNKISFDTRKEMVCLYWNDKMHRQIPFNQFSRLGWHRYVWHGPRSDEWFANVYVVMKHQKPIRLNWYLADRTKADEFTTDVNAFWAEMQNIDHIDNQMPDEYTNFMKDNVRRHQMSLLVSPKQIMIKSKLSSEIA
eukprot:382327_1